MVASVESNDFLVSLGIIQHLDDAVTCWQSLVKDQAGHDSRISADSLTIADQRLFLRNVILDGRLIVVSDSLGELIGIATISIDSNMLDNSSTVWNISDVWVRPNYRRMGIATMLVSKCEQIAQSRGATEIRLQVYTSNQAASMMYGRLGYRTVVRTMRRKLNESNGEV